MRPIAAALPVRRTAEPEFGRFDRYSPHVRTPILLHLLPDRVAGFPKSYACLNGSAPKEPLLNQQALWQSLGGKSMRLTSNKILRQRRGLSFVEFMGCLVAMTGGVVLGSMYLGVDVQKMAVGVLEQAQVIQPGYFDQAPAEAITESTKVVAESATPVEGSDSVVAETDTDPNETTDIDASVETQASLAVPVPPEPTAEERRAATRAYWDQLTAIMLSEAQGRTREVGNPDEWGLYDFLTHRKQGHEKALEALEVLEPFAVDDRLISHGEQVISWHKSGSKLFENALSLLSDGPGAKISGPFAQSWQSSATQLRMEEKLVIDRHKGLANYLDREYADEAPFKPAFAR